jgi:putative phosphoesterase
VTRLAVISDTHIPVRAFDLPATAWRVIESSDGVLHGGDIMSAEFLGRLRERSRQLWAVRGNNDHDPPLRDLPDTAELDLDGVRLAMVHDSGTSHGRRQRLRSRFPGARVVVFGHSHMPLLDDDGDLLLLNPGSPTDRRRMPSFTMAVVEVHDGRVDAQLVDLGRERAAR